MLHFKRPKIKHGDTLIEVTLAIGIFSLVAVAIVSVVSTSTSSAQVALESTLAREEIDNQAEALRFIQSSYVNSAVYSKPDEDSEYQTLWKAITDNAKTKEQVTDDILLFHPSTCDELYEGGNLINQSAFIINTRNLSSEDVNQIVLPAKTASVFYPAETYPHLIYGTLQDDQPLYDESDEETNLLRASGIYVIAVKDPDSTNIVSGNVRKVSKGAAYYDFYIRACWYAPGAEQPTTISTVIRLYDPGAIEVKGPTLTYKVVFKPNGSSATDKTQVMNRDEPTNLSANSFTRSGYKFVGWNTEPDGSGTSYADKAQVNNLAEADRVYDLYAQWTIDRIAMQNMNKSYCTTSKQTTVYDTRDNSEYTIQRLADGKCWMTKNLRLDFSKYGNKINASNTHNPAPDFVTAVNKNPAPKVGVDYSSDPYSYGLWYDNSFLGNSSKDSDGNTKDSYGVYYSLGSASAGNMSNRGYRDPSNPGDICPAGWHLPTGVEADNIVAKAGTKMTKSPNNFVRAGAMIGDWHGGTENYRVGYEGFYWSYKYGNMNDCGWYIGFSTTNGWHTSTCPANNPNVGSGMSVRCILTE